IFNINKIYTTALSNDIFLSIISVYRSTLITECIYSITDDILKEKAKRSKLETIYRRNKTPANKANFKNQARFLNKLITASRRSYFHNLISCCTSQPKKLWSALDSLLSRKPPPCLPTFTDPSQLASSFLNFFVDNFTRLCATVNPASVT